MFTLFVHVQAQPNPFGDQGVLSDLGGHKVVLLHGGQGEEVTPCPRRRKEIGTRKRIRRQPLSYCWVTGDNDGV